MSQSTTKIQCLIVDDEPLAQKVIEGYVNQYPYLEVVDKCDNAMMAFEALHKYKVDIIFLDINMPVITGLNFLKSLNNPPLVVFTTAYSEYALDGFELNAIDYLLKPIAPERFQKAIEKITERLNRSVHNLSLTENSNTTINPSAPKKQYMFVKADGKLVKVEYANLLYCEGMKDYIKLHLKSGQYLVIHQTMKNMEEQLPNDEFMRVHKSYIISISALKSFHDNMVHFNESSHTVPVSNSYKEELMSRLS